MYLPLVFLCLSKVCPHFHLSLQSGCQKTLENMNRRYTAEEYAQKCSLIREYYPAPALTTDVIVGFPMESEADFEESFEFVKNIHFYETHIFKYSRRQGTKAAAMEGQITEAVKAAKSEKMLEEGGDDDYVGIRICTSCDYVLSLSYPKGQETRE